MNHDIKQSDLNAYAVYLQKEERAQNTIAKYQSDISAFLDWACGKAVDKQTVMAYKEQLLANGKAPGTVNGTLAALHGFFAFMGWHDCRVKYLKIQRRIFCDTKRELSREEYTRLVQAAQKRGDLRLSLLLQTICATGVRVSELQYLTAEAVQNGKVQISLKGKIRVILIPGKLQKKLLQYAKKQKIASGEIFITKSGKGMSRRQIWSEMKRLCKDAGVAQGKVFPHNLRHLFARSYYKLCKDIVMLADVLGHSSIETTRIYLITTITRHQKILDQLGFVS